MRPSLTPSSPEAYSRSAVHEAHPVPGSRLPATHTALCRCIDGPTSSAVPVEDGADTVPAAPASPDSPTAMVASLQNLSLADTPHSPPALPPHSPRRKAAAGQRFGTPADTRGPAAAGHNASGTVAPATPARRIARGRLQAMQSTPSVVPVQGLAPTQRHRLARSTVGEGVQVDAVDVRPAPAGGGRRKPALPALPAPQGDAAGRCNGAGATETVAHNGGRTRTAVQEGGKLVAQCVHASRGVCKMRFLNGAAPVCFGWPTAFIMCKQV